MKEQVNKLIANFHILLFLYGLYGAYELYSQHAEHAEAISNQFPAIESDIQSTEKRVAEIQDFVKKADEYKTRVDNVAKTIEAVQKQLPAETNDSQILQTFSQDMNVLNIKDPSFVPGAEETSTYYISKDYSIRAKGTFLQFLIFFERLGTADRIYNIKTLKLTSASDNQRGRFQIISAEAVIQAFRFNPNFKVERGFEVKGNP